MPAAKDKGIRQLPAAISRFFERVLNGDGPPGTSFHPYRLIAQKRNSPLKPDTGSFSQRTVRGLPSTGKQQAAVCRAPASDVNHGPAA